MQTYTIAIVFAVASIHADEYGTLDGDVFWVRAIPGYANIAEMTKQMMSLVISS